MSERRFVVLLGGLDEHSRFRELWARTPRVVDDPADIAAITGVPAGP